MNCVLFHSLFNSLFLTQRKAERLAQLRDDPYYIIDDRPKMLEEDVDSIPVVHLDDMPLIAPGK